MPLPRNRFTKNAIVELNKFKRAVRGSKKFNLVFGQAVELPLRYIPSYVDVYSKLLEHLPQHSIKKIKIADFGSGASFFSRFLQSRGATAFSIDKELSLLALAKKTGLKKIVQGDILKLPFKKESLDCVVMHNFFDSFYLQRLNLDPRKIGEQVFNVLKPNGLLVIKNPKLMARKSVGQLKEFHYDLNWLSRSGFQIIDLPDSIHDIAVLKKPVQEH